MYDFLFVRHCKYDMQISCTVFELFDVEYIVTLTSGLEVIQGHSN